MNLNNTPKVKIYLNEVCSEIKNKRVHAEIKEELLCHIEEITLNYIDSGINEEEALNKAISKINIKHIVLNSFLQIPLLGFSILNYINNTDSNSRNLLENSYITKVCTFFSDK